MDISQPLHAVAITEDPELLDLVLRLGAASGVTVAAVAEAGWQAAIPRRASSVLIDARCAAQLTEIPAGAHRVAVLCTDEPSTMTWRRALSLRADRVIQLPDEQQALLDWLVQGAAESPTRARTIAVTGGRGGVGASTLVAALARTAQRDGRGPVTVLDLDALGGGLDLLLGCEDVPGLRWSGVADVRGRVSASALRSALPVDEGVALLTWDRDDDGGLGDSELTPADFQAVDRSAGIPAGVRGTRADPAGVRRPRPETVSDIVVAAQHGTGLVLMDLPRGDDAPAATALALADCLVLVSTADVRGVASAGSVLRGLAGLCDDVRVVVRRTAYAVADSTAVATSLGLPVVAEVPTIRGMERAINEGLGPSATGRLRRECRRILDAVAGVVVP
jgi:MinD-like ATPase involved in chromosome partitioning or flagellar assembly